MRLVAFRFFDGFSAFDPHGGGLIVVRSRKSRALLAYLAIECGREVSREKLADLLWGNHPDDLARQSLRQCLAELRAIFRATAPDMLLTTRETVGLRPDLISVDALEFLELTQGLAFDQAARIYRGEFLGNLGLESTPFAEWVRTQRNHFASIAATVFQLSAEKWDAVGEGKQAIAAAERLVEIDAFREDWQRLLIRLYARYLGRQRAVSQARNFAAVLRRDLDVDPEPATLDLVRRIKQGHIHAGSKAPAGGPSSEFVI